MNTRAVRLTLTAAVCLMAHAHASQSMPPRGAEALRSHHAQARHALAHSPFGRPLVLAASASSEAPAGEVHAVLPFRFETVSALQRAEHWCEILTLQTNVKRCTRANSAGQQHIEVAFARRYTDPVNQAHPIRFQFTVPAAEADYLAVNLSAPHGPLGSRHYRLRFEAVPVGEGHTFVHLAYSYTPGFAARVATQAYLATSGRDKVGFTTTGHDSLGRPVHVRGVQGAAERNTMRYFLAIESFLDTLNASPAQRLEARLRHFHAALERHPAQLHETELNEYLDMKRREAVAS